MRFHLDDARRHRQVAKALTRAMRAIDMDAGHTGSLDLAARLYGYADRHELDACLGRSPASLWDEDEAPGVVAARRERQEAALAGAGVPADRIAALLDSVRPTNRNPARTAGVARAVPVPTAARTGTRSPTSMLDEFLDAWDRNAEATPEGRLATLVRQAYDEGYDRLRITMDTHLRTEVTFGAHSESARELRNCGIDDGIGAYLDDLRRGETLEIDHPSGPIPISVTSSPVGTPRRITCTLHRNLRPPAPTLEAMGVEGWVRWEEALVARVGLHFVCGHRGGMGRIVETLADVLAREGIELVERACEEATLFSLEYVRHRAESPGKDWSPIPHETSARIPRSVVTLQPRQVDKTFLRIVATAIASGQSVIVVTLDAGPREWVERMLLTGMTTGFMRSILLSSATSRIGSRTTVDAPDWVVDVRQDAAFPA